MMKCPKCDYEQEERDACAMCGVVISKYQERLQEKIPFQEMVRRKAKSIPWEDRTRLGFIKALISTLKESIFSPSQFFKKMPVTGGIWDPTFYIVIVAAVLAVSIFSLICCASFFDKGGILPILEGSVFLTFMTCVPFYLVIIISLFILSGTIYLAMLLLGATKNGPEATFRAIFYSAGPISFFLLVPFLSAPFIGSVVGGMGVGVPVLWLFDLLVYVVIGHLFYVIGLREVHQTTTGKVSAAVILGHVPMIVITPVIFFIIWLIFLGCCGCEPQFCYCPVNRRRSSIRILLAPLYNCRRKQLRTRLEI